jgi:hypothetical protein
MFIPTHLYPRARDTTDETVFGVEKHTVYLIIGLRQFVFLCYVFAALTDPDFALSQSLPSCSSRSAGAACRRASTTTLAGCTMLGRRSLLHSEELSSCPPPTATLLSLQRRACLSWALIITSNNLHCRPWSTIQSLGLQGHVHHQGLRLDHTVALAEHCNNVLYTLAIYDTRSRHPGLDVLHRRQQSSPSIL